MWVYFLKRLILEAYFLKRLSRKARVRYCAGPRSIFSKEKKKTACGILEEGDPRVGGTRSGK